MASWYQATWLGGYIPAGGLFAVLQRAPLEYEVVAQSGSHRKLRSAKGYPDIKFSWHDQQEIPPGLVRRYLTVKVGLPEDEARRII